MAVLVGVGVMVAGCGSSARQGARNVQSPSSSSDVVPPTLAATSTAASTVRPAAVGLSFSMPVSGFALYGSDAVSGVRIFDVDRREVGIIEGWQPQQYYGSADGVVVERDDGLWLARPGTNNLVPVPLRRSSGLVVPGWIESGRCATHPERPSLEICDREITVRDDKGGATVRVSAPNLFPGRWIDAFLSPDAQWVGANWQGECEVVWGFVASVDGGTPVALIANADGPAPSGFVTWLASGEAVGAWRPQGDCGDSSAIGIYRFRPGEEPRAWFTTSRGFAAW